VVYVPKSYDAARVVPMLIALHGTNLRGADMLSYTDLPRKAESAGFILVAPDSRGLAFNDGFTTGGPESAETDDVGFIETVAEDVKRRYKIDSQAVFLTGFSSGASMVQRMEIESRYPFRAYASVANALRVKTESVAHPAPLLLVFGSADPLNPVAGGEVSIPVMSIKPSHEATAMNWATRLGCRDKALASSPAKGVQAQIWVKCASSARLTWYEIEGLGHHWAGADSMPFPAFIIGDQVSSPNLSDLIWDFFDAARR
jgi:polyhydroxybutyrate depolymerase